ncbi:NUDIX hydrolase N-terminal domain-containing protein [Deinococcus planocerae]|uniref:NUDIX hydrolase N-terminal domain-containing protein n=1 Tax=Deinococcus planocerae TaxID=1737569 RepID=UPI0011AF1EDF|nr:NUDIX hydrolase N-terminal domain-containing protein [Deinococcus planocerae]
MTHPHLIADELRALALLGLSYVRDPYDLDRYRRVLMLSAELAAQDSPARLNEVRDAYLRNLAHVSPLLGVEAVVTRGDRVLLMRRADSGLWGLPGGLADVGETVAGAAERELFEEVGLRGRANRLLGLLDARYSGARHGLHIVTAIFDMEAEGEPRPTLEAREVGWHAWDALPELHPGHASSLRVAQSALASGTPSFDPEPSRELHAQAHPGGTPRSPHQSLRVRFVRLLMRTSLGALLRG